MSFTQQYHRRVVFNLDRYVQRTLNALRRKGRRHSSRSRQATQRFIVELNERALAITRNAAAADEAVSATLLKLLRLCDRGYQFKRPATPLVLLILRQFCIRPGNSQGQRRTVSLVGDVPSHDVKADSRERRRVLMAAAKRLPRQERVALIDQFYCGLTLLEAAARRKVSVATIGRWRASAQRRLTKLLNPDDF